MGLNKKIRNLVVCIPGLSGDSRELYCLSVAKACLFNDLDFVVVNNRGTSKVPLTVSKKNTLICSRPQERSMLVILEI